MSWVLLSMNEWINVWVRFHGWECNAKYASISDFKFDYAWCNYYCWRNTILHGPSSTDCAPGPDGICPKLLKLGKPAICHLLADLFQQSIDTGCVPSDWKVARVIAIFKSGDSSNASNYRPISLTSTCCQLLEHIISSAIMQVLAEHDFFFVNQHGFLHGRSCETQLFELFTDVHHSIHSLHEVDAIFVDFAKADWQGPLLAPNTQTHLNINTTIITWITNFLTSRYK